MILIIAGTNRPDSNTEILANHYREKLQEMTDEKVELLRLFDLQEGLLHKDMYEAFGQSDSLRKAQDNLFIPATKWIIVSPEYNGSFPGILKLLLDALSVRAADSTFRFKKVALAGISSGRAGNWLGMNQLTSILNYLKMNVYYNKLAISHASRVINDKGIINDAKTRQFIMEQMEGFLEF